MRKTLWIKIKEKSNMKFIGRITVIVVLVIIGVILAKLGLVDKLIELIKNLLNR